MSKSNSAIKEIPYELKSNHELQCFVGPHEAAKFIGVSVTWVYERTRKGIIPHFKVGKYLKFDLEELEDWMKTTFRVKLGKK